MDDFNASGPHVNLSKETIVENFVETTLSTPTTEQNNKKSSSGITSTTKVKCNNSTSSKICVTKTKSLTTTLIAENISPTTSQIITTTTTKESRISFESFTTSTTTAQGSKKSFESLPTAHIEKDFKTTTSQLRITPAKDINKPKTRSVTEDKRKALKRPTTAIRKDVKSKSSKLSEATTTANASQVKETSIEGNNFGICVIGDVSERDNKGDIVAIETTNLLAKYSISLKTELITQNNTSSHEKNLGSCTRNDVSATENIVPMKTSNILHLSSSSLKKELATQNNTSTNEQNLGNDVPSSVLPKDMTANIGVKEAKNLSALTSTSLKTELAAQNYTSTDVKHLDSFVTNNTSTTDRPSNIVGKETTTLLVLTSKSLKTEFTDHDEIESTNIQESMKPVNVLESSNLNELLRTTKSEINFDFGKSATTEETLNNPKPSVNELETSIISTTEFIQSLYKKSVTSSEGVHQQHENQERGKTSLIKKKNVTWGLFQYI